MEASDEATTSKHVKLNVANKNKSHVVNKFTSQLASELFA